MLSIEIVNLGIGNVDSVGCWLESNGYQVVLIQSPEDSDPKATHESHNRVP